MSDVASNFRFAMLADDVTGGCDDTKAGDFANPEALCEAVSFLAAQPRSRGESTGESS